MGHFALSHQRLEALMDEDTTRNFWSVLKNFQWPEIKPVSYRLYHDDQGVPLFYTMEDLPGTYIEVDQAVYVSSPHNVRVQNGKLTVLPVKKTVTKLRPDTAKGTCCHPLDICVLVDLDGPYQLWSQHANEVD